jgi:hypothetical protein
MHDMARRRSRNGIATGDNEWACFLDDDAAVNISNLADELSSKRHLCTPRCFVSMIQSFDSVRVGPWAWPQTAWCMQKLLVEKLVTEMFDQVTDEQQVKWNGNDDMGLGMFAFSRHIMLWHTDKWAIDHRPSTNPAERFTPEKYFSERYSVYHQEDANSVTNYLKKIQLNNTKKSRYYPPVPADWYTDIENYQREFPCCLWTRDERHQNALPNSKKTNHNLHSVPLQRNCTSGRITV